MLIVDKAFKVSVILMYFNSVAHMDFQVKKASVS